MNSNEKKLQLSTSIRNVLTPLINRDYFLLEVPYYTNIGDTLIWQGEIEFLKNTSQKCKGMFSLETYTNPKINEDDLILFQGGGNFGDLWAKHHEFKKFVMQQHPHNKYIFFPQTVYYKDERNLKSDASFFSKFKNVTICARDRDSYKILTDYFSNDIRLLPDMAFCISKENMVPCRNHCGETDLLLKRLDSEYKESTIINELESKSGIYISDWKTMLSTYDTETKIMEKMKAKKLIPRRIVDFYAFHIYRKHLIRSGIELLSSHKTIYTTRLHAAILGVLLEKDVVMIDNSYGKNRSFFESWLNDCSQVSFRD